MLRRIIAAVSLITWIMGVADDAKAFTERVRSEGKSQLSQFDLAAFTEELENNERVKEFERKVFDK